MKCKHEWRLAEKYPLSFQEKTKYVFFCIHCLELKAREVSDFYEEDN